MKPREFEADTFINNSPEAVIDYISDVHNRPMFLSSLKSVDNIEGDSAGAGATWTWKWVALGMEFEGTARCTKKESGRLYAFESEGGIKSSWTYTAEAKEDGTALKVHVTYEVPERALSQIPTDDVLDKMRHAVMESATQNLKTILDRE